MIKILSIASSPQNFELHVITSYISDKNLIIFYHFLIIHDIVTSTKEILICYFFSIYLLIISDYICIYDIVKLRFNYFLFLSRANLRL